MLKRWGYPVEIPDIHTHLEDYYQGGWAEGTIVVITGAQDGRKTGSRLFIGVCICCVFMLLVSHTYLG